jgi:type I restriction enzyme S subunit
MNGWRLVPLGEVMTKSDDRVPVMADGEYPNFGIFSFGRGLFQKQPIRGAASSATTLYRAKANQFVYSRLFAFEGAYGLVPPEFDGCFVSNEFPLFNCDTDRVLPGYVGWFFRNPSTWPTVAQLTTGMGNRRQRIKPEALLSFTIPHPPLDEQRRIVARIDSLAAKIDEARVLRDRANAECDELCRSILRDVRFGASTPTRMSELVTWRKPDVQVVATDTYHFAGVYCFGRGVFRGQQRTGLEFAYRQLTRIRAGEFIYPKLMAWEGALAVVPDDCDGLYVSPEFPVFTIHRDRVLPEVLDVYFRSPAVWPLLSGASTGTNVRRKRLNPNDFLKYEFPLPPREAQTAVRAVREKMKSLQSLQNQEAQINALLPSILDRAFKGELS